MIKCIFCKKKRKESVSKRTEIHISVRSLIVVVAGRMLARSMWDLVPSPGTEPGPPALGVQSLSHKPSG